MFKAILVVHTIYLSFFTSLLLHCFDRSIHYFRVLPVLSLAARIIPLLLAHIHFSFSVIRKKFGTFFFVPWQRTPLASKMQISLAIYSPLILRIKIFCVLLLSAGIVLHGLRWPTSIADFLY